MAVATNPDRGSPAMQWQMTLWDNWVGIKNGGKKADRIRRWLGLTKVQLPKAAPGVALNSLAGAS